MYHEFYRLKSTPFPLTPDPTLRFASTTHKAALDALAYGITTRQGLVVITGASGLGKTMLVQAYLARVAPPQLTTIAPAQARLSFTEVLTLMAHSFDMPVATDDPEALQTQIRQRLLHEFHTGRNVALIIDEAQHLPPETLERLWGLAHPSSARESPLQIVLVGQPALRQHLQCGQPERAAPRIGIHATLVPLTGAESLAYIRHHVAKVALPGGPLFTPGALRVIVRHAHGVPGALNLLCTDVLQAGFRAQQQPITAGLVRQVIAASTGVQPFPLGRLGLAATAGLVLAAGLLWVAPFRTGPQATHGSPAARVRPEGEAPRPTSAPWRVVPRLQRSGTALQARAESPPGSALSHNPGEGQPVEPPSATPTPRVTRVLPTRTASRLTVRRPAMPTPPTTTEITAPRPGDAVGQTVAVEGFLAELPPEQQVFLCVQSQAFGRRIYPQGRVVPDGTGRWTVKSIYATTGYRYETFLVHTSDPASAALLSTPHARKYGLPDLPPSTQRLGPTVVVMRE